MTFLTRLRLLDRQEGAEEVPRESEKSWTSEEGGSRVRVMLRTRIAVRSRMRYDHGPARCTKDPTGYTQQ